MWVMILTAVALVLVIEGALPFLVPRLWREAMIRLAQRSDHRIRIVGLISMLLGAVLMMLVHAMTAFN